ncbi:hypothetical protein OG21DRAFT_1506444 [Imleria badia]|nr:hypothetical protein OG21DRAFT_1506444 [Imleria badia]
MTRVFYRRYLRSEISEEEWAYRKRQPVMGGATQPAPVSRQDVAQTGRWRRGCILHGFIPFPAPVHDAAPAGETSEQHQRVLSANGAPPRRHSRISSHLCNRFLHRESRRCPAIPYFSRSYVLHLWRKPSVRGSVLCSG